MQYANNDWNSILALANLNMNSLMQPDVIKQIDFIIKINERVCESVGHIYLVYLRTVFTDLLNVYGLYS